MVTFPKAHFAKLLEECQPATFGIGREEVLDEEYCKAVKMDTTAFCTSFTPYEYGVIDAINKALVRCGKTTEDQRGVKAELYKLNVIDGNEFRYRGVQARVAKKN